MNTELPRSGQLFSHYKIVIIVGSQRTGTTMIGNILGAHPKAFLIDESNGLYSFIDAIFNNANPNAISELFRKCCIHANTKYSTKLKCDAMGVISDTVTHLVFQAPNLTYSAAKIAQYFNDPICIFTCRDVRDVVVSMSKLNWIPMVKNQLTLIKSHPSLVKRFSSEIDSLSASDLQAHIARAMIATLKMSLRDTFDLAKIKTLNLRYEDLVQEPDRWINIILKHVRLSFADSCLNYADQMTGWGPGLTFRRHNINTLSIGRWQDSLSSDEEQDIWKISQPLMKQLGYSRHQKRSTNTPLWDSLPAEQKFYPIVATGRGGSGTRLLSNLLSGLNIFLGNRMNPSSDSLEWVQILCKIAVKQIKSPEANISNYWQNFLRETAAEILIKSNWDGQHAWGWKLPETMFTLPEVYSAFEHVRIIHLIRHPVDVSLRSLHMTSKPNTAIGNAVLTAAYQKLKLDTQRIQTDPEHVLNAISWAYQVEIVARFGREVLGPNQYLEIKYEDICRDPFAILKQLAEFLDISLPEKAVELHINATRKRLWSPPDSRVDEVWNICASTAVLLGYQPVLNT